MRKNILTLSFFLLIGVGCTTPPEPSDLVLDSLTTKQQDQKVLEKGIVSAPLDSGELTYKLFGEYFQDRFTGYHVGDDYEIDPAIPDPVPIYAIADGVVVSASRVGGYGGLITILHNIENKEYTALYGHISTNFLVVAGQEVRRGEKIAELGVDESGDTDGERRHLHFAIYEGNDKRIKGYETQVANVDDWVNPQDFFAEHGLVIPTKQHKYSELIDPQGKKIFGKLDFTLPAGWDVEYVPSIQSLNLFEIHGKGTTRERSQIFIRYFDASDFLTLSTVNIFSTEDLTIGQGDYVAREYDIEKKTGVANFKDQPDWRNERHAVTDFRGQEGFTRYYVVAASPYLDVAAYDDILDSIVIK